MLYAILTSDRSALRELRNFDETKLPDIKLYDGLPLAVPVEYQADPVYDSTLEKLSDYNYVISSDRLTFYRTIEPLSQTEIDKINAEADVEASWHVMRNAYQTFHSGTATVEQVQKAIAWLIKQEGIKRGANVS